MSIGINIALEWDERESDHRPCYNCSEMIIGKMYVLVMFVNDTNHEESETKVICQPCKELINDSNSNK